VTDIDYANGFLRINHGKGVRDRVVLLGQNACQWVRQYVEQVRSRWSPPHRNEPALWLSSHAPHQPLKSQVIEVMVRRYGKLAGLSKRVTPHLWRHTCATHLVQNQANLRHVQDLLGHRSLATTERYLRLTITDLKEAHAKFHPREQV
jgi:integrase/recombinase XerD